ncbi:hypothetical protein RYX36_016634 [Vicia faba]
MVALSVINNVCFLVKLLEDARCLLRMVASDCEALILRINANGFWFQHWRHWNFYPFPAELLGSAAAVEVASLSSVLQHLSLVMSQADQFVWRWDSLLEDAHCTLRMVASDCEVSGCSSGSNSDGEDTFWHDDEEDVDV